MDLVNKKNRLLSIHTQIVLGFFYHLFHVLFSRYGSVDLPEPGAGGIGDHFRQGSLSCSRRAVKNNAAQFVRFDSPVKQLILSNDMFLAHNLIQSGGPQSGGQRGLLLQILFFHIIK